jgi:hypothetical protein
MMVYDTTSGFIGYDGEWSDLGGGIAGPISSTDNALVRWDGEGGETLQNSNIIVDDTGNMTVSGYHRFTELVTPPTGADGGFGKLYVKSSDSSLYFLDSSGSETDLLAGGVPEPFTPSTDPWQVLGRISSPDTGTDSERFGKLSLAGGLRATALGYSSRADGDDSISIGNSYVYVDSAIAIGDGATCGGQTSVVIGPNASTTWWNAVSIGSAASVAYYDCVAVGASAYAGGSGNYGAVGIGTSARATRRYSVAIGYSCNANHEGAVVIGYLANSTANNRCNIGAASGARAKSLQIGLGFGAWGVVPPGTQPSKVSDPTDLPSALTTIAALIDIIEGAGLAASV